MLGRRSLWRCTVIRLTQPELLISAGSLHQIDRYIHAGASAVLLGESRYGMRLPADLLQDQMKEAISLAHHLGAKAYIHMNKLFRNEELVGLPEYLKAIVEAGADAIVFGDPAVLLNARQYASKLQLHWNAEMTGTNSSAASYWGRRGASRAVIARELNEEEIVELKKEALIEVQIQVHGMTNIYHSQRNLVQSYLEHLGRAASLVDRGVDKGLFLIEAERPDERFPVYEDQNGTHVMSPDDICLLEALPELIAANVDSFYVEGLMKSEEYNETVLKSYSTAIQAYCANPNDYRMNPEWLTAIEKLQGPERELGFGFLYKEQVY